MTEKDDALDGFVFKANSERAERQADEEDRGAAERHAAP